MRRALPIAIVALCAAAAAVVFTTAGDEGSTGAPRCSGSGSGALTAPGVLAATRPARAVVRTPPSAPGHEAWTGLWTMPDDSLMVGFTEAVGPVDPAARELAPQALKERLGVAELSPDHDFYGLDMTVRYMRSDDGADWEPVRADPFRAVYPNAYAASATIALEDGTLLRRVNGWDLQGISDVPHTAFLQRLAPGASDWSEPEVLLDPKRFTYQLSRIRRLADGCLLALGQVWSLPAGSSHAELQAAPADHLLLVSRDDGRTWRRDPVVPPAGAYVEPNEWDVAELPDGDLLALFRTRQSAEDRDQALRTGRLAYRAGRWELADVREPPFPFSGHPELLATREGPILSLATDGVQMTTDGGSTWTELEFAGGDYVTDYYPQSVQSADGTIHVASHRGFDSGYGEVPDQRIIADSFRLVPPGRPGS